MLEDAEFNGIDVPWDRRYDNGLPPGSNDLRQLSSENVGPDPDFAHVAAHYDLPIVGHHT